MTGQTTGTVRQLTGPGRSAIATIEVTGDLARLDALPAIFRARSGRAIGELAVNALCFGVWGDPGEDVVVCRTGESSLEITCHGGLAAVSRILDDVALRNFVLKSGGCELTEASNVIEAPATQSASHAGLVVNQIRGRSGAPSGLRLPLSALRTARTQRVAEILLEQTSIDWENVALEMNKSSREVTARQIKTTLAWAEFGRHLVEPWDVVLCGRPNVGKSSLMNALAGFTRSIVSEHAGTTRDRVTLETAIQGWPVRITDTAGVRDADDAIEKEGISQTLAAMDRADLVIVVLDGSEALTAEDRLLLNRQARRQIVIANKADLPVIRQDQLPPGSLMVSSVRNQGIDELLRVIAGTLVPELPPDGEPIPVTVDQIQWLRNLQVQLS